MIPVYPVLSCLAGYIRIIKYKSRGTLFTSLEHALDTPPNTSAAQFNDASIYLLSFALRRCTNKFLFFQLKSFSFSSSSLQGRETLRTNHWVMFWHIKLPAIVCLSHSRASTIIRHATQSHETIVGRYLHTPVTSYTRSQYCCITAVNHLSLGMINI